MLRFWFLRLRSRRPLAFLAIPRLHRLPSTRLLAFRALRRRCPERRRARRARQVVEARHPETLGAGPVDRVPAGAARRDRDSRNPSERDHVPGQDVDRDVPDAVTHDVVVRLVG